MNYRIYGIIAMIGAPFLFIDASIIANASHNSHFLIDICRLVYISAIFCSVLGLWRLCISDIELFPKILLSIGLFVSALAWSNCIIDLFWPHFSSYKIWEVCQSTNNIFIPLLGLAVALTGKLDGWKRNIWLIASIWLLITLIYWLFCPANYMMLL